jgi:hypothetical protein
MSYRQKSIRGASSTDRAPGITVYSYDYFQLHLQGTNSLPMSILAQIFLDSKFSGLATFELVPVWTWPSLLPVRSKRLSQSTTIAYDTHVTR